MSTAPTIADVATKLDTLLRQQADPWPRWLSIQGAATYASLSEASVRRLLSGGKLTAHRPCKGKVLVDRHQLDALVVSATARPRRGRGIRAGTEAG